MVKIANSEQLFLDNLPLQKKRIYYIIDRYNAIFLLAFVIGEGQIMENIIDSIIDIDKTARNRVSAARKEADAIISEAEKKREAMKKESHALLEKEIEDKKRLIKDNSDSKISEAEREAEEKCRSLEEKMEQGRSSWKTGIIGRITGA